MLIILFLSQLNYVLSFIRSMMYSLSIVNCLMLLYVTWIRPKLEYALVAWNSVISTDTQKLECIQQKFVSLCQIASCPIKILGMTTHFRSKMSQHSGQKIFPLMQSFITIYTGLRNCPSLLDNTELCVPVCNVRDSLMFSVTHKIYPSSRCIKAANTVCRNVDLFRKIITLWKQILY